MTTLINDPTFRLYAICCIVLCLILLFLSGYTGAVRGRNKSPGNPEDAKLGAQERVPDEHPDVIRVGRCHRNAMENIPMFFALGLVYTLAGASATGAMVCFIGFTAARLLHVVFHLKAAQPWRSVAYGLGVLALLGMMVLIGMAVAAA
jgi:prostaglandin-E synthase 1